MKVLFDENMPHPFRRQLVGHDVFTVAFMRWRGLRNGRLLARAADHGFDVMVTTDRGIAYEQNPATLPVSVVILHAPSNGEDDLAVLVPELLRTLATLPPRSVAHVG